MLLAKENYAQYGNQEQLPVPKKKVRIRKRRKLKLKPAFVVASSLVLVFFLGLLLASQYARIATTGYDIVYMKKELAELKTDNERLHSQYNELQSLERVEKIATTKLGMVPPSGEGFIYIPVESKKYNKGNNAGNIKKSNIITKESSKSQSAYIEGITNFVKNWKANINQAEGESLN